MERGKYVNRSTYQKEVEKNKKLLADIRVLVEEGFPSADKLLTIMKWRKKFNENRELYYLLREVFDAEKIKNG